MLSQLKIGSKLKLGFGLVLGLLCLMAALAAWQMGRLADNTAYFAVNLVPSYESEHAVALDAADLRRLEFRHVASNTAAEMDKVEAQMADLRKDLEQQLSHYAKDLVSDDTDRAAMDKVRSALDAYYAEWDKLKPVSRATASDASKTDEANKIIVGESADAYARVQSAIKEWWGYNVKLAANQTQVSNDTYANAKWSLGALTALALALGAGAAVVITHAIVQPIQRAVDVASTVAEGDLRSRIEVQGADESAQLLQALSRMNQNLARIVGQVRNSSDSIATGSTQIATGNADLSQRTEEQASNLQQTAASMEQLSGTVKANAETAGQASMLASEASMAAAKGGELVGAVVTTMQDIAASSSKIADIIGVIDGIAFQTNILALNAAVEAARAGEQGRGFAVVAGEVRSLAGRCAEAAKEIKTLIGASVERVQTGASQVEEAGSSMDEIVSRVQRVAQLINEMSQATVEQSTGITQVGEAVSQLDQVTQQNAALVEESAAAAESLRHQAASLAQVVGLFKLEGMEGFAPMAEQRSAPVQQPAAVARKRSTPAARMPEVALATTEGDNWETF